jgi:hypothetical protein
VTSEWPGAFVVRLCQACRGVIQRPDSIGPKNLLSVLDRARICQRCPEPSPSELRNDLREQGLQFRAICIGGLVEVEVDAVADFT